MRRSQARNIQVEESKWFRQQMYMLEDVYTFSFINKETFV